MTFALASGSSLPGNFAEAKVWAGGQLRRFDADFHIANGHLAERSELRRAGVPEHQIDALYPFSLRNYAMRLQAVLQSPAAVNRVNEALGEIFLFNQFVGAVPQSIQSRSYDLYGFIWPHVQNMNPAVKEQLFMIPALLHVCTQIDRKPTEDWDAIARTAFLVRLPTLAWASDNLFKALA